MQQKLYVYSETLNKIVEVLKPDSERYHLLMSVLQNGDLEIGRLIDISKERLNEVILKLLSERDGQPLIDFGNRFDENQCYELMEYEGEMYRLMTSGYDNLLIFAINLYNNLDKGLKISDLHNS